MKVFATDLDGTLVHNKKVTETDREAIAAFQKENLFGVCTGRPLSCLYDVEGIPFDFYIVKPQTLPIIITNKTAN